VSGNSTKDQSGGGNHLTVANETHFYSIPTAIVDDSSDHISSTTSVELTPKDNGATFDDDGCVNQSSSP
jgi:hypothetical protein